MKLKLLCCVLVAAPLLLPGCASLETQPMDMLVEYQFLDSPDAIYEACGEEEAVACARVVGNRCLITLPKVHWNRHLDHEMRHCFGGRDAPEISSAGW